MNKYSTFTIFLNSPTGDEIATTIHLVKSYNKLFHNAQHLLLNLNNKERCFYDYLCEKMESKNRVYVDLLFKENFLEHYSKIKKKGNEYKQNNILDKRLPRREFDCITKTAAICHLIKIG